MKKIDIEECKSQLFVCTNERPEGKSCCKKVGGLEFYQKFKDKIKANPELYQTHWVMRSGCLGFCNTVGTTVAIHQRGADPEFFNEVTPDDFDALWNRFTENR